MNTSKELSLDQKIKRAKFISEFIWWIVTFLIVAIIMLPVQSLMNFNEFIAANLVSILVFLIFTRHIFFLKYSFLAQMQWLKFLLIFACIPLNFKLIEWIFNFQAFLQNQGLESFNMYFIDKEDSAEKERLLQYFKTEYLFFGVSSVISAILFPVRLLISFWRVYNKTGKV